MSGEGGVRYGGGGGVGEEGVRVQGGEGHLSKDKQLHPPPKMCTDC